jgi:hypothetical protein
LKILIGLRKVVSNRCKVKRVELEKDVFLCENFATIATNGLPVENFKNA